jgi:hypothetical protein
MRRWQVYYHIRGPGGQAEVPNTGNPVEAPDLRSVLARLAEGLPDLTGLGAEVIGVRVSLAEGPHTAQEGG